MASKDSKYQQPETASLLEQLAAGAQLGGLISGNNTVGAVGGGLMDALTMQNMAEQKRAKTLKAEQQSQQLGALGGELSGLGQIDPARAKQIKLLSEQGNYKGAAAALDKALTTPELVKRQAALVNFRNNLKASDLEKVAQAISNGRLSPNADTQQIADFLGKPLKQVEKSDVVGRAERAGLTAPTTSGGVQGFIRGLIPDSIEGAIAPLLGARSPEQFQGDVAAQNAATQAQALANAMQMSPGDPARLQQQAVQEALGAAQTPTAPTQPLQAGERYIRRSADGALFIQGPNGIRPAN